MDYIQNILFDTISPLIRKSCETLLGDLIDKEDLNWKNLTINGLQNINLNTDILNERYFQNFFFRINNFKIGEFLVKLQMNKIIYNLENIKIDFFLNKDICDISEKKIFNIWKKIFADSIRKKMGDIFKNYEIEIKIKKIDICFKMDIPTKESNSFFLKIDNLFFLKKIYDKKKFEKKKIIDFKMDLIISGIFFESCFFKKNEKEEKNEIYEILKINEKLIFSINVSILNNSVRFKLKSKIDKILIFLNKKSILIFFELFLTVYNFGLSNLLFINTKKKLEKFFKKNIFLKILKKFKNQIEKSVIYLLVCLGTLNYKEISEKKNFEIIWEIILDLILNHFKIIFYDEKEFLIKINPKSKFIYNYFLDIFPFENFQFYLQNLKLYIMKQNFFFFY